MKKYVYPIFKYFYIICFFSFLYLPVIIIMIYSFNSTRSARWKGFTLKWYQEFFKDTGLLSALSNSVFIGLTASVLATLIITLILWHLYNHPRFKKTVFNINTLALFSPDIIMAISFLLIFRFLGIPKGFLTLIISHIILCLPYAFLSILPNFELLSRDVYEAALDLGATPKKAFWKVIFPELLPGVIASILISFSISVDDFVISYFNTGSGVNNLSLFLFAAAKTGFNPKLNAFALILFVVAFSATFLFYFLRTSPQKKSQEVS